MNKYCPKLEVFMIEGSDFKQGGEVLSWAFCVSGFHFTQQKMVLPIVTTWKITYYNFELIRLKREFLTCITRPEQYLSLKVGPRAHKSSSPFPQNPAQQAKGREHDSSHGAAAAAPPARAFQSLLEAPPLPISHARLPLPSLPRLRLRRCPARPAPMRDEAFR